MLKKFRKSRKGFTMVELMVVIIIMAVLGLAIMPSLMGSSDKTKYSRAWNDLNAIANAFVGYYGKEGTFPKITAGPLSGAFGTSGTPKDTFQSFLNTPLANLKDPWNQEYQVASGWVETTGKGWIIVYVNEATGGGDADFGGSAKVTGKVKKDPYQNNVPMAKLVINVM